MSSNRALSWTAKSLAVAAVAVGVVAAPASLAFADTSGSSAKGGSVDVVVTPGNTNGPSVQIHVPGSGGGGAGSAGGFWQAVFNAIYVATDGAVLIEVSAADGYSDGTLVASADDAGTDQPVVDDSTDSTDSTDSVTESDDTEQTDGTDEDNSDEDTTPSDVCDQCPLAMPNPDGDGDGTPWSRVAQPTDDGTGPWGPAAAYDRYATLITAAP